MHAVHRVGVQPGRGLADFPRCTALLAEIGGHVVVEDDQTAGQREPRRPRPRDRGNVDVEDPHGDDGFDHSHDHGDQPAEPARIPTLEVLKVADQFPLRRHLLVLRQLAPDLGPGGPVRLGVHHLVGQCLPIPDGLLQSVVRLDQLIQRGVGVCQMPPGTPPTFRSQLGQTLGRGHALHVGGAGVRVVPDVVRAGRHQHRGELTGDRLGSNCAAAMYCR